MWLTLGNNVCYFDNNATTEMLPEVKKAIHDAIDIGPSNPSSPHNAGESARALIARSRDRVAMLIGSASDELYFTSSGTESNNWALNIVVSMPNQSLLTTPIEHESVLSKAELIKNQGVSVAFLPVDSNGIVRMEEASNLINSEIDLVSVQWVNSETGVIQPIEKLAELCKRRGVLFHTDAAQAVGKIDINVKQLGVDYLSFTGHKIHAPMGIGVLYKNSKSPISRILCGGSQEYGLRPGSENIIGIAGLCAAVEVRAEQFEDINNRMSSLRDKFESEVLQACDGACLNTDKGVGRVSNTTNIRFRGVDGEALVVQLNNAGIYCSQGSACTSAIPEPSHTLLAMGLTNEEAYQSIRFSFSELNTSNEVDRAVEIIAECYSRLKAMFAK